MNPPRYACKHGSMWTPRDDNTLLTAVASGAQPESLALRLGRTERAVRLRYEALTQTQTPPPRSDAPVAKSAPTPPKRPSSVVIGAAFTGVSKLFIDTEKGVYREAIPQPTSTTEHIQRVLLAPLDAIERRRARARARYWLATLAVGSCAIAAAYYLSR